METLFRRIVFVFLFLIVAVLSPAFIGIAFAQSDLDGDGIPDADDPETIISTNKTLDAGEYTFKKLVITSNSSLTLNSDKLLAGFKGVKINAENITIDKNSFISADGKGYGVEEGPGAGHNRGGGGYGGKGAKACWGNSYGGPTYGSAIAPTDLGSGGWVSGGGAIRLNVSNTLVNEGKISANGASGDGGGSGGSIYITSNNLSGSGVIEANGGSGIVPKNYNCDGGGGGRVAVYYQTSTFSGQATAKGGEGGSWKGIHGEDGTVL